MEHYFESEKIEYFLNMLDVSIFISDEQGNVLFENTKYLHEKAEMESWTGKFHQNIQRTLKTNKVEVDLFGNFVVKSEPIPNACPILILTQIRENILKQDVGDRVNFDTDFNVRLSNLNLKDCIANSASMIEVFEKAKQVASYPTTVLLVGETGVGKEVVASFIHRNSNRMEKPFIKINCSAIPEQLLESELFGYESGAFTGAKTKGKPGLFELANQGTLLLDEIGDMSFPLQSKLLRVLQDNKIMRLGGRETISLDVRVISSTNRDLKELMESGQFSDALYYRLNVVELRIPPLRERLEDIYPLSTFYLTHFREKYKLEKSLSSEVGECFMNYKWPGNIRELKNTIENIIVSSDQNIIKLEDLPQRIIRAGNSTTTETQISLPSSMQSAVEQVQRTMIHQSFKIYDSMRKVAYALDMDPATLHRLIKKLNINLP